MNLHNLLGQHSFWMINKKVARKVGVHGALLLADLISKRQYFIDNKDIKNEEEWFFNTQQNIELDTTLTPYLQREAIQRLKEAGFIDTKQKGVPKKRYFIIFDHLLLKFLTTVSENSLPLDVKKFDTNKNTTNNNKINRTNEDNQVVNDNTYLPIDSLKKHYLENQTVVNAVINNPKNNIPNREFLVNRLEEFNSFRYETGRTVDTVTEYAKHFRNWNQKAPTQQTPTAENTIDWDEHQKFVDQQMREAEEKKQQKRNR